LKKKSQYIENIINLKTATYGPKEGKTKKVIIQF